MHFIQKYKMSRYFQGFNNDHCAQYVYFFSKTRQQQPTANNVMCMSLVAGLWLKKHKLSIKKCLALNGFPRK